MKQPINPYFKPLLGLYRPLWDGGVVGRAGIEPATT